jgi:topoisomerase-4 subunit A
MDLTFSDINIKGRSSKGNLVTKYSIKRVELKSEEGVASLKTT